MAGKTGLRRKGRIDYWLFLIVFILVCIGLVMVLSASQYSAAYEYGDSYYFLKQQLFNIIFGLAAMFLAVKVDYRIYARCYKPIFALGLILMLYVMVLGEVGGGSRRWIQIGPIGFQPSDIMKLSMLVMLCRQLVDKKDGFNSFFKDFLPYMGIAGLSCGLVAINDLGTGMVMGVVAFLLFVIAGVPIRHLISLVMAGAGAVGVMVAMKPYRIKRLTSFLDPWGNYYDGGYQVAQSLLAMGSGGLRGVGLGEAGAKWFYLPEEHTDFIFAILVEEGGFLAGMVLLLLFLAFTWRGFTIALKVRDSFGRLLASGLTLMITVQALINIIIAMGFMPVTGITLPFISYGGTSLVISLAAVGVLLNISAHVTNK